MLRLFNFFSTYRNVFLFCLLEFISIWIVIQFNQRQRHNFGDLLLEYSSVIHRQRRSVTNYFQLIEENEQLSHRIAELQAELEFNQQELRIYKGLLSRDSLPNLYIDSLTSQENFEFIPCAAIKNTTHKNYNYITLDKGLLDGVQRGMGLVSPNGIAGKVIQVSDHFSLALSALNVSFKLSAKVVGIGNPGLYEWGIEEAGIAYLNHIPANIELKEGMEVITSGYSTVFPEGYLIGTISKIKQDTQDGTHKAQLSLATNFNNLGNLFLVSAIHKDEVDELDKAKIVD